MLCHSPALLQGPLQTPLTRNPDASGRIQLTQKAGWGPNPVAKAGSWEEVTLQTLSSSFITLVGN